MACGFSGIIELREAVMWIHVANFMRYAVQLTNTYPGLNGMNCTQQIGYMKPQKLVA